MIDVVSVRGASLPDEGIGPPAASLAVSPPARSVGSRRTSTAPTSLLFRSLCSLDRRSGRAVPRPAGNPPVTEPDTPPSVDPVAASALACGDTRTENEPPWSEIRAAYVGSRLTVAAIAEAYGITTDRLWSKARRGGWPKRRDPARTAAEPLDHRLLVGRLFKAVERQIAEIERRFDGTAPPGLDEKDARTLAALARTLELLIGLDEKSGRDTSEPEADIDEFRLELARRLESLRHIE